LAGVSVPRGGRPQARRTPASADSRRQHVDPDSKALSLSSLKGWARTSARTSSTAPFLERGHGDDLLVASTLEACLRASRACLDLAV